LLQTWVTACWTSTRKGWLARIHLREPCCEVPGRPYAEWNFPAACYRRSSSSSLFFAAARRLPGIYPSPAIPAALPVEIVRDNGQTIYRIPAAANNTAVPNAARKRNRIRRALVTACGNATTTGLSHASSSGNPKIPMAPPNITGHHATSQRLATIPPKTARFCRTATANAIAMFGRVASGVPHRGHSPGEDMELVSGTGMGNAALQAGQRWTIRNSAAG
jgi:hypothetical protein